MPFYIIAGIVIVIILLIVAFASRCRTLKPDEAMIITGALTRDGMKIVKAGGAFVWPVIQRAGFLSLQVQTLDIRTPEVYTIRGVPVMADGVAQIKIKGDHESIATAAEQFLGRPEEELRSIATQTMEGRLRAIFGRMTLGQPQIAAVKRDAEIAKANALRDEQIAKAKALEEGKRRNSPPKPTLRKRKRAWRSRRRPSSRSRT